VSGRAVFLALGGLVVVALVVLGGLWLHDSKEPPAVGQGLHRFTVGDGGSGANDPGTRISIDGHAAYVRVIDVEGATAQVDVQVPDGSAPPATGGGQVRAGDSFDVGPLRVRVAKVWSMPSRSHSAVDLELTAKP